MQGGYGACKGIVIQVGDSVTEGGGRAKSIQVGDSVSAIPKSDTIWEGMV